MVGKWSFKDNDPRFGLLLLTRDYNMVHGACNFWDNLWGTWVKSDGYFQAEAGVQLLSLLNTALTTVSSVLTCPLVRTALTVAAEN